MSPLEHVLGKLDGVKKTTAGWMARCPAHDDRNASLGIREGDDERVLINCHAGCATESVLTAIGLTMRDLFAAPRRGSSGESRSRPERESDPKPGFDWKAEAERCSAAITTAQRDEVASQLGVHPDALVAIGVGIAGAADLRQWKAGGSSRSESYPEFAYTFPERYANGQIVGLSLRAPDGRKGFPSGASRGLIVPTTLPDRLDPILFVEGATDAAALESLDIGSIARPSAASGAGIAPRTPEGREPLAVGGNDEKADGSWPGRDGARAIARAIAASRKKRVDWT